MNDEVPVLGIAVTISLIIVFIGCCMGIYPQYFVYSQRMRGEAELAHAEYSKRVAVETAKAAKDSASLYAESEVLRAEGVAKANKIIGDSLHGNESYLRYLWIQSIDHESAKTIVYVPTEANLPILEANRLKDAK